MKNYYQDAKQSPKTNLIICLLLAIGIITLPTEYLVGLVVKNQTLSYLFNGIIKILLSIIAVYFIFAYRFNEVFTFKIKGFGFLTLIVALIIAISNFPFYDFLTGKTALQLNLSAVTFLVYCIGVASLEELFFRGLIFPLSVMICQNKKRPLLLGVITSSAIFGLTHLVNIFGGNIGGTLLQVGYSFLIGALCAITLIKTKNIFFPVIVHAVYNFCGQIPSICGNGVAWSIGQIILTATVGVVATIYFVVVIFKVNYEKK